MYQEISDEMFVNEMRILWQNINDQGREELGNVIRYYFEGDYRAERIINKMQERIESI